MNGFFTLNLDKLASRAYSQCFAGCALREFIGIESQFHADVLRTGHQFVAHLHGTLDSDRGWVLTQPDFENLCGLPAYRSLVQSCFASRIVLFAGVSADDQAAGGHLLSLKAAGIGLGGHFWLTNRNDRSTDRWAEEAGLNRIYYAATKDDHSEFRQFIKDLKDYLPKDEAAPPVVPSMGATKPAVLPESEELERLAANDIRIRLNARAKQILGSRSSTKLDEYEAFWTKYSEPIYRAWSVSTVPGKNLLFDFQVQESLAKGAFGQVYKALHADGRPVAIKVLHGNVRDHREMLRSFRRGVASMRILSGRSVDGVVPYIDAWEIPACAVMELIDGPNLEQAVDGGMVKDWHDSLRIACDLARIIQAAHSVPERVLHRDIRPANVMLKDLFTVPERWKLVVLDFDLSWHRDASEGSLDLSKSLNSYLAPEQIQPARKRFTRNALVDSYGFGMTMYFLVSGEPPAVGQHLYQNWRQFLNDKVALKRCAEWHSLPRRFARLIDNTTKDSQAERWDMTRISGELQRLQEVLGGPGKVTSAEIFAEEIVSRCPTLGAHYEWDLDRLSASAELRSGFTVKIVGDETNRLVRVRVEWIQTGDRQFENVRKYIGRSSDSCAAELKRGSWKIGDKQITGSSSRIEAVVNVSDLRKGGGLEAASNGLAKALECLRLL